MMVIEALLWVSARVPNELLVSANSECCVNLQ